MSIVSYEIVGVAGTWRVSYKGKVENGYQMKEAAFEAAITAARQSLRQGHEIRIAVRVAATTSGVNNAE